MKCRILGQAGGRHVSYCDAHDLGLLRQRFAFNDETGGEDQCSRGEVLAMGGDHFLSQFTEALEEAVLGLVFFGYICPA